MNEDRGAFIWYELMTPDPLGAKAFYGGVVGWDIDGANAMPGGNVDYRMIKRADGGLAGGVLTLSPEMVGGGAQPGWIGYVHVFDVDEAVERVVEAGGTLHMGPENMEGIGRMAMIADPWGATIYVMTPTPPADDPDAKSDVYDYQKAQHVRWNELQTSDPAGAVRLYGQLFGWEQKDKMPMGEMGDYLFISRGDGMIGAIMPEVPGAGGTSWSYYIGVDDIDRAAKAVTSGGGTLNGEIMQIPGGEYSVHCSDPQGASFGLVGPRKE
jgi:predicted enzyme related to lactoylglutathione lyase